MRKEVFNFGEENEKNCLFVCLFVGSANAAVITTTFSSNNGQSGNMFDVVNLTSDLTVTGFDLNLDAGSWNMEVYKRTGGWSGFENSASGWDLVGTGSVTSAGSDLASFFDVADFLLDGLSTTALYITSTNGTSMNYTNGSSAGSVYSDNGDLQILEGLGKSYPFGTSFNPRVWNGSIYYENTNSVPEPTTLAMLGLGLAGIGFSRKKKTV